MPNLYSRLRAAGRLLALFAAAFALPLAGGGRAFAASEEIVVDNTDKGFTADAAWKESVYVLGFYGKNYAQDDDPEANPDKWAMWTPEIAEPGQYQIYMRWISGGNRPAGAPLEITHAEGTDYSKSVNQRENGGKWVYVGTYPLAAGTGNSVKLMASDAGYTVADAVKFVPVSEGTAEPGEEVPRVDSSDITVEIEGQTETAREFPVYQKAVTKEQGGQVRGFGMLAKYGAPGPKRIYLKRTAKTPAKPEPFLPVSLARVFDPNGNLVAFYEFTDQTETAAETVLTIPDGPEGIYRVSFSGGREGDVLEIGLPKTDIWGVRGEMALGITETTPKKAYIYTAQTTPLPEELAHNNALPTGFFALECYGKADAELFDEKGNALARPQKSGSRNLLTVDQVKENTVWSLEIKGEAGAIAIDGVPGLLCPSRAAAEALRGGTVESEGMVLAGPLQGRIRKKMLELYQQGVDVKLEYPKSLPADILLPEKEMLLYGSYGILFCMDSLLELQVLEPDNPRFGQVIMPDNNRSSTTPAAAVVTPGLLNPAYMNEALIRRAVIQSLSELVWMQGDDLLRTQTLKETSYPITGIIFSYNVLVAEQYYMLKDYVDEETRELWKQAVMCVADKLADFKGYQSNQWSFMMLGHLNAYLATGEDRILGYFERQMNAYVENTHGVSNKFGQHPAGYYLEEFGPDGNYDSLNAYHIGAAYNLYQELQSAKPELVQKMHDAIEKNLEFKQFFWLRQPDDRLYAPTAFNCRVDASISAQNYPGDYIVRSEFPLALRRYQLNVRTPDMKASGSAPFLANTREWQLDTLGELIQKGGSLTASVKDRGVWTAALEKGFSKEIQVEPGQIPTDAERGTWELPGMVAFKRGPLYGAVLYDVAGSTVNLKGKFGGGPTVFWSEGTGNSICSMRNASGGTVKTAEDITHSCVFGTKSDGSLFYTGNEHPSLTWLEPEKKFEIKSEIANPQGTLSWIYDIGEEATTVTVTMTAGGVQEAFVNLPVYLRYDGAAADDSVNGRYVYEVDGNKIEITWDASVTAQYAKGLIPGGKSKTVDCIRLPIQASGKPLRFTVRAVPASV